MNFSKLNWVSETLVAAAPEIKQGGFWCDDSLPVERR